MTYAQYVHRGFNSLIAAVILAAGFVLLFMRKGGEGESSKTVRLLTYVWIAQNAMLVISLMLRMELYVEVYFLTWSRVIVFIWMGLVIVGLALMAARIACGYSNGWLIRMNAIAVVAVVYACSFVDFPKVISSYNLAHYQINKLSDCQSCARFDFRYNRQLGAGALPAIDEYLANQYAEIANCEGMRAIATNYEPMETVLPERKPASYCQSLVRTYNNSVKVRNANAAYYLKETDNWRGWGYRKINILSYLETKPSLSLVALD